MVKQDEETRLGLGLALSLTTRETVGRSLHFCASSFARDK